MELLDSENSLHGLANTGSVEEWSMFSSAAVLEENEYLVRYQLNRRNGLRYTALHTSIFSRNLNSLIALVDLGCDVNLKCFGTPCLHIALGVSALPGGLDFGLAAFAYLLPHSDITSKDDQGATVLHIASELNLSTAIAQLLNHQHGNELMELKDRAGLRAIHRAAAADAIESVRSLIAG
jgi:ankyrin repeat protein